MPIRGRPRLEEAKRRLPRIRLVLTEREVAVIDHYAQQEHLSPAAFCREIVFRDVRDRIAAGVAKAS